MGFILYPEIGYIITYNIYGPSEIIRKKPRGKEEITECHQ